MKYALIIGGLVLAMVLGALGVYVVGVKRIAESIGQPTSPEKKQQDVDKAKAKAADETKVEVQEVRDATLDENIDLGRDLSERGRLQRHPPR